MKSFIELSTTVLRASEGQNAFILSEHLSQDPLENYFGQQRGKGGRCENPSMKEVLTNASSIRLQVSSMSKGIGVPI